MRFVLLLLLAERFAVSAEVPNGFGDDAWSPCFWPPVNSNPELSCRNFSVHASQLLGSKFSDDAISRHAADAAARRQRHTPAMGPSWRAWGDRNFAADHSCARARACTRASGRQTALCRAMAMERDVRARRRRGVLSGPSRRGPLGDAVCVLMESSIIRCTRLIVFNVC